MSEQPELTPSSKRAAEIVTAARELLEAEGPEALTLRAVAEKLGIRAPSLYKHVPSKAMLEAAIIEQGLAEIGSALHAAARRRNPLEAVLLAYRKIALKMPNLYRLATSGPLDRGNLAPGLEDWAGEPFFLVTGEPYRAQALWSFAHGMVILEIDGRFPSGGDLTQTWTEGIRAFASDE